jgi:hypothetical protein
MTSPPLQGRPTDLGLAAETPAAARMEAALRQGGPGIRGTANVLQMPIQPNPAAETKIIAAENQNQLPMHRAAKIRTARGSQTRAGTKDAAENPVESLRKGMIPEYSELSADGG